MHSGHHQFASSHVAPHNISCGSGGDWLKWITQEMFSSCTDFQFPLCSATHKYQEQNFSPQLPCITSSWPATLFGTKIIWVEGKWTLSGNICALSRSMVSMGLFECFRKEFKVVWYGLKEVMSYFLILASKCRKQKVTSLGLTLMEFTLLKKWCDNAWQIFFWRSYIYFLQHLLNFCRHSTTSKICQCL